MTGTDGVNEWRKSSTALAESRSGRGWLMLAYVFAIMFRPNFYPTVAFFFLLNFTFLQMLSLSFRLYVLAIVYVLTFAVPHATMHFYRRRRAHNIYSHLVPYVIHILSYLLCMHFVWQFRMPSFVLSVIAIAICLQCICTVISFWWRVCVQSAAVGAVMGALVVYASVLAFNPVWWLCAVIFVSGLVGSSCMFLRLHTFSQIVGGTWIGICCGLLGIMLV